MASNPKQSQDLGRRLYQVCLDGQDYWFKMQIHAHSEESEQSFLHELDLYVKLNQPHLNILLPHALIHPQRDLSLDESFLNSALLIQDSKALFAQAVNELSYAEVMCILQKSADMLERLHQIGYLHGDLKVEHFRMLQNQGYLIDFEQSHLINDAGLFKNSATPRYMAPELFHAEQKSLQSDIYALGIIWLEWLTGQKLQEKSYLDWAKLHCQRLKVALAPQFQHLEIVLIQMLMKIKAHRCSNIYQIKQILSKNV